MVRVMISTGPKIPIGVAATPYRCKSCGMAFDSKKELQAHIKTAHGGKKR